MRPQAHRRHKTRAHPRALDGGNGRHRPVRPRALPDPGRHPPAPAEREPSRLPEAGASPRAAG
jgi:hypothetical protein